MRCRSSVFVSVDATMEKDEDEEDIIKEILSDNACT